MVLCAAVMLASSIPTVLASSTHDNGKSTLPPLYEPSLAYDPATNQLILFGGSNAAFTNATWNFTGSNWEQLHPAVSPPPRQGAALAYDPDLRELILVGGSDVGPRPQDESILPPGGSRAPNLNATWAWTGATWKVLTATFSGYASSSSPFTGPELSVPQLTYDQGTHELILDVLCRSDCERTHSQTWMLNTTTLTWQRIVTPGPMPWNAVGENDITAPGTGVARPICTPSSNEGYAKALTALPNDEGILYVARGAAPSSAAEVAQDKGDPLNHALPETWLFRNNVWSPLPSRLLPSAANNLPYPVLAPTADGSALLFAGNGSTWLWNHNEWHMARTDTSPGPRCGAAMAYDPELQRDILVSGVAPKPGGMYTSTWEWSGTSWHRILGPVAPQRVQQPPFPSIAHIPTTRSQIVHTIQSMPGSTASSFQVKLVRAESVPRELNLVIPNEPGRLYWLVLAKCPLLCVSLDGGPNAVRTTPQWSVVAFDAESRSVSFPSGPLLSLTSYPTWWHGLQDLSTPAHETELPVMLLFAVMAVLLLLAIWRISRKLSPAH